MKSLMICPFIDKLPYFVKNIIENYTWKPDHIAYIPNDPQKQDHENRMDYKSWKLFEKMMPDDIFVMHATDHYLMPDDLRVMIETLQKDEKAFCIGIHPIIGNKFAFWPSEKPPHYYTRIVVWKAKLFLDFLDEGKARTYKYLAEKKGKDPKTMEDITSHIAEACVDAGYHPLQACQARMFTVNFIDKPSKY